MPASQFNAMSEAEIDALPELPLVIARCDPDVSLPSFIRVAYQNQDTNSPFIIQTKVRMIEAGKRRGKYMAMTGDGVNDAPSLKLAPVGIGMGQGSDVAKNASELVLTDNNFDSIRAAIREGRRLFDNIQRFVLHLLATNVAEVILLICGLGFMDDSTFRPLCSARFLGTYHDYRRRRKRVSLIPSRRSLAEHDHRWPSRVWSRC